MSYCEDTDPADHICDLCGVSTSICGDENRDHLCDVCLKVLSVCEDADHDHLCDICEKVLSQCIDEQKNYVCDICGYRLPYITVVADEGCLVNDMSVVEQYSVGVHLYLTFSYVGDDENTISEWIIYTDDGSEFARVKPGEIYVLSFPGSYYVTPVFS